MIISLAVMDCHWQVEYHHLLVEISACSSSRGVQTNHQAERKDLEIILVKLCVH